MYLDTLVGFLARVLVAAVQALQTDGLAKPDVHSRRELRQNERRDELLLRASTWKQESRANKDALSAASRKSHATCRQVRGNVHDEEKAALLQNLAS